MDVIQNYAGDLYPGIGQCLLTYNPLLPRLRAYSNLTLKFEFTLLSLRVCDGSAIQRPVH
jgi:hypothetical protein